MLSSFGCDPFIPDSFKSDICSLIVIFFSVEVYCKARILVLCSCFYATVILWLETDFICKTCEFHVSSLIWDACDSLFIVIREL